MWTLPAWFILIPPPPSPTPLPLPPPPSPGTLRGNFLPESLLWLSLMGQEYRGCQMFFIDSADVGSKPCVYFLGAYDLILLSKGLPVCNVLRLLEPPPGTVSVMRVVYVECLARSFVLRKGFPRWHPKTELQILEMPSLTLLGYARLLSLMTSEETVPLPQSRHLHWLLCLTTISP